MEQIIDILLSKELECSRNKVINLLKDGNILVNGLKVKNGYLVKNGDNIDINIIEKEIEAKPEKIDLDINFRSSKGITEIAKQVINQNSNRLDKNMQSNQSQNYEQGDIITYEFDDRASEVDFIIKKIKQLIGCKYIRKNKEFKLDFDDIVILVSSVKKIPELISGLEDNGIDFIVEGTKNLFDSEEIIILCDTFSLIFSHSLDLILSNHIL